MKRILKLLARLYPSTWRTRYGAEYEALLDDATPRPQDAFNILWGATKMQLTSRSFVKIVLPCAIGGALIAAAISFAIQPRYSSQTLITVTEFAPVTGDDLKQALSTLRDSTLNRDFLALEIKRYNLYPRERASMPLDEVVDKMLQSIEVRPQQPSPAKAPPSADEHTSAFAVYFVYPDPHLAQQVDGDLIMKFVRAINPPKKASASEGPPQTGKTFRIENGVLVLGNLRIGVATHPTSPIFPKRSVFALGGLISGLLCGLILATFLGTSRGTATANS
jgi:hypothetical protein